MPGLLIKLSVFYPQNQESHDHTGVIKMAILRPCSKYMFINRTEVWSWELYFFKVPPVNVCVVGGRGGLWHSTINYERTGPLSYFTWVQCLVWLTHTYLLDECIDEWMNGWMSGWPQCFSIPLEVRNKLKVVGFWSGSKTIKGTERITEWF